MKRLHRPQLLRPAGFTLLEMMVVLALIAMVAGIALPNFMRTLESYSTQLQWNALGAEIDGLPFRAFSESREIQLTEANAPQLLKSLPEGWKVSVAGAIRYRDNGWCEGGKLRLMADNGETREMLLLAPACSTSS